MSLTDWPATAHAACRIDLAESKWTPADRELAAVWCLIASVIEAHDHVRIREDSDRTMVSPATGMMTLFDATPSDVLPLRTTRCVDHLRDSFAHPQKARDYDGLVRAIADMTQDMELCGAFRMSNCVLEATLRNFPSLRHVTWCNIRIRQAEIADAARAVDRARAFYELALHEATAGALSHTATEALTGLTRLDARGVRP